MDSTFRKDFDIMVEAKCKNVSIPFEEAMTYYLMVALMTVINVEEQNLINHCMYFSNHIFMTCKNVSNM